MAITIEEVVEKIPDWHGRQVTIHALPGGLTNTNYRVEIDDQPFFVRIPGPSPELLAIDRDNEYHNTMAAAEAGVGPRVLYYLKEHNVMVMEFIRGKTMSIADMHRRGMPARLVRSLKLLHAGPRFRTDFDMFRLLEFYMQVVAEHSVQIPDGYLERLPTVARIEETLNQRPLPTVPCHNDLVAENCIDDGKILRIVDFEYSGNNDPCFEMGDTATELGYNEAQIAEMCAAYFGESRRSLIARIQLLGLVSDVGWVLWTAIQNTISKIGFDFWGHTMHRWKRALKHMDSADFPVWLKDVQRAN